MQELLEKAIEIAVIYHKGQVDKGGDPYILHPLAVAARVQSIEEKIVAYLHDVPEDTILTLDDLRNMGFPEIIVSGVDSVTKRENETRAEALYRAKQHILGKPVKIADILENSNIKRIPNPTEKDYRRIENYQRDLSIMVDDGWIFKNKKWKKVT